MTGPLTWDHPVQDIPDTGLPAERTAAPDELDRLAKALDLEACSSLSVNYTIMPTGNGRYRLYGSLTAEVRQPCVVTLEPIMTNIAESFSFALWPEADMPAPTSGEVDLDDEPDPEPILDGRIDVGRLVFECLAGAIDPFPRKPGATLAKLSAAPKGGDDGKSESPFAVLAQIKPKS